MRKFALLAIASAVVLLGALEAGGRLVGAVDFPLYDNNNALGYVPLPNQSGRFLNKNDWCFNDKSMGVCQPFRPSPARDIVLVGDSIVLGGNGVKQANKLGPQLALKAGASVWPISAGSWSLRNELAYLRQHPEVMDGADCAVFIVNSGDLTPPSVWALESTHPTHRPVSSLAYLFSKYVIKPKLPAKVATQSVDRQAATAEWRAFVKNFGKPVYVALYADRSEFLAPKRKQELLREPLSHLNGPGVQFIEIQRTPRWNSASYRDDIHPSATGTEQLSEEISGGLQQKASQNCNPPQSDK